MIRIKHNMWIICVGCWALAVLAVGGCGSSPLDRKIVFSDLQSQNPLIRIRAIKWAADNEIRPAIPPLVDSLQNEDQAVRFYAIEALRRLVGTNYGYDYKAQPNRRAAAIQRWKEFVESKEWDNGQH